jgi:hypothetical protein
MEVLPGQMVYVTSRYLTLKHVLLIEVLSKRMQ